MADHLNHAEQELYGEALAVYHYTGWWRSTHDIDVYVAADWLERAPRGRSAGQSTGRAFSIPGSAKGRTAMTAGRDE